MIDLIRLDSIRFIFGSDSKTISSMYLYLQVFQVFFSSIVSPILALIFFFLFVAFQRHSLLGVYRQHRLNIKPASNRIDFLSKIGIFFHLLYRSLRRQSSHTFRMKASKEGDDWWNRLIECSILLERTNKQTNKYSIRQWKRNKRDLLSINLSYFNDIVDSLSSRT